MAATPLPTLQSPNGKLAIHFSLSPEGVPGYDVKYGERPVLLNSAVGFSASLHDGFSIAGVSRQEHQGSWKQVYGERGVVPDNYRQLHIALTGHSGQQMQVELRAYNGGLALRYIFPGTEPVELGRELTEFHLPADTFAYEEHGTEGAYARVPAASITPETERPLMLELHNGLFASILEADSVDFPRMLVKAVPGEADTLVTDLGGDAQIAGLRATPWRLLLVGEKPGDLLENDYIVLNLNAPNVLADTTWIKPGKVMREVSLTTDGARAVVDFAAAHNLQYVLFDWGWYGVEDPKLGDATQVRVNVRRANGQPDPQHLPLDLPWVIQYAKEKGIGVFLYVDRRQIRSQRDILFPLYEKRGVKGVKIGFVDVGPQQETAWVNETIRKAAESHILLDIYDQFRPSGYMRTYPNLLTVEGVRGNEHFPTAQRDATLPFTCYLAGSADYTICYYDTRIKNTHAHQLGMTIISYSPLQSVFWYDKPSAFHDEPEIRWFEQVPTVWDDTHVITGEIGKYAALARRSGSSWFVGVVNGNESRSLDLPLTFLPKGKRYQVDLYTDDPAVTTQTHIAVKTQIVTSVTVLTLPLQTAGGAAMHLTLLP